MAKLDEKQTADMIKITCQRPDVRQGAIHQQFNNINGMCVCVCKCAYASCGDDGAMFCGNRRMHRDGIQWVGTFAATQYYHARLVEVYATRYYYRRRFFMTSVGAHLYK